MFADVKYKGVECIYTFRGEAMFLVRPSTIPGGGLGLYAAREFPANKPIVFYQGTEVKDFEEGQFDATYVMQVQGKYIDGYGAFNGAQYTNDCRNFKKRNNLTLSQTGGFVPRKKILPGAELLIPYGKAYWSAREALLANAKKKQRPLPASKNNSGLWAILKAVALMALHGRASPPASRIAPTVAGPFPAHVALAILEKLSISTCNGGGAR